ncbi:hypothetical protein [Nannocystis bainbridge]|uniref:Methyltransferase domain-containing protein n=1 Tax=Nannocystis bainbridge TaxID=2995303 RepID=A0ABT5DSS4_9BACT|nr:hypothetical protein [Nannocystis bainbridge]MDC0716188.1 hypothetical protein [Nannocystis bainbridge]
MSIRTLARVALGYVAAVESMATLVRFRERSSAFRLAVDRAGALGRPLVVIGDPDGGMHTRLMRAYGCGDVCVDMNGCPKCPVTIVADITKGPLPGVADDSGVVFVSCVLEYVTDLQAALAEIARIAGKPENVFIVTVQPWTLTARLYPGAHWRGDASEAKGGHTVRMTPVTLEEKLATTLGLGVLAATAFWPKGK